MAQRGLNRGQRVRRQPVRPPNRRSSAIVRQNSRKSSGMDPSLKAALILLVPTAGLRLLVIFWLDLAWVGLLIMSLVYLLSGYLAAVFFFQQCGVMHIREQTDPVGQKGAAAGIVLCLLSWTIFVLVVAF